MRTSSKIALGVIGAIAAGVVIGLLIAPEKGSDIRKRIRRTTGDWADNLGHLFSNAKKEMNEAGAEEKMSKMTENFS